MKPPEIKPVVTALVMILCIGSVGDPFNIEYNKFCKAQAEQAAVGVSVGPGPPSFNMWCLNHSLTAEKWFRALRGSGVQAPSPAPAPPAGKKGQAGSAAPAPDANPLGGLMGIPVFALFGLAFAAASAQLGALNLVINGAFMWIFGTVLERKLLAWRYPLFLIIGLIASAALLTNEVEFLAPQQKFIGPIMFFFFVIGGYLVVKPKKPFKPADWKPLPWKVFKDGDDAENTMKKTLKIPYVSPWTYIGLFAIYAGFMYVLTTIGGKELSEMTHIPFMTNIRQTFLDGMPPYSLMVLRPIPALECLIAGTVSCYVIMNIVFQPKVRREAGDMQIQAVLQYKELRALDMNHKQAVEGTSRLLGVPLDIVKDWIAKGLQTPPKDD